MDKLLLLLTVLCSVLARGLSDVVKYTRLTKDATAARAFVNREDQGVATELSCAVRCVRRNRTWPLQQCNAYVRDPATGACEIGSYDVEYAPETGNDPIDAGKEVFNSTGRSLICQFKDFFPMRPRL